MNVDKIQFIIEINFFILIPSLILSALHTFRVFIEKTCFNHYTLKINFCQYGVSSVNVRFFAKLNRFHLRKTRKPTFGTPFDVRLYFKSLRYYELSKRDNTYDYMYKYIFCLMPIKNKTNRGLTAIA